jgi:hypothetical protein
MIYQHIGRDSYTDSQNAERVLNAAIIGAEIADSYEEYLDIFEAFYADEIEVSGDTQSQPIRGKARVRALLFNFLVPLHVMAEVGGLSISIRETPIPGDAADETHSAWTLDLAGGSGAVCTLNWCVRRRWDGSRVVYERHYDAHQIGGPLTQDDLSFNTAETAGRSQRPS